MLGSQGCVLEPDDGAELEDEAFVSEGDDDAEIEQKSQALAPSWNGFWDYLGADLDTVANQQRSAGRRPVSVTAYGTTSEPRYAGVFAQRSGAAWRFRRGTGLATFGTVFSQEAAQNYKPTLLSFDGPADNPVWCAVFEQTASGIPWTRHMLTSGEASDAGTIQHWLAKARTDKLIPSTISVYGGSTPRYAIVLEPNSGNVAWAVDGLNETHAQYQARWSAQVPAGNRPSVVALNSSSRYTGLFRDDSVGALVGRHGLTAAQLSTEVNTQKGAGRYPISIQGGGSGSGRRFSALFAETEIPLTRSFRVTRGTTLAADTNITAVDNAMRNFMARNGVRHASLAVLSGRDLAYARGYTHAESGYPVAAPTTHFRLASVSKTVTALEIMRLQERGLLGPQGHDTPVQNILNLRTPAGGLPNARFNTITIRHLLTHNYPTLAVSGVARCLTRDASTGQNTADAFGVALPVTTLQAARFALTNPDFVTRSANQGCYSNYGYMLLGLVIENRRGTTYLNALRTDLFNPLSITRARIAPWNVSTRPADEAFYRSGVLSTHGNVNVAGAPLAAGPYSENYAAFVASGGLSMAAPDMACLLANLNVTASNRVFTAPLTTIPMILNTPMGFDQINAGARVKGGSLNGSQNTVRFIPNGISYVLFWARDNVANSGLTADNWWPSWGTLETALSNANLPARTDLFPSYGMPAL